MSDKSNKYGYVGVDIPAQSFGSNKGVFNPAEINELVADNKWTTVGELELITSYTVTSGNNAGFNNLESTPYDIYFLTMNNVKTLADNVQLRVRFSTTNGSTEVVSGYNFAFQRATTGSLGTTFQEVKSQNNNLLGIHNDTGNSTNETVNGYIYLYNLLDSSNYSYLSHHLSGNNKDGQYSMAFGGGVNRNAQKVNGFNIGASSNFLASGDFALYGLKVK